MSSGTTAMVRYVQCPKCRSILGEKPSIPVYQCGGCFTTLRAKSQRQTLSNEDHNGDSHQHDSLTSNGDCSSKEPAFLYNGELLQSASVRTHLRAKDIDETSSFVTEVKTEAETDANDEIGSIHKRSKKGKLVDTTVITTCSPEGESLSSYVFVSSSDELLVQPQEPAHHGLDHLRSTETFYSSSNEQLEQPQKTAVLGLDHLRSIDAVCASPNEPLEQLGESTVSGLDRLRSTDTFYVSSNEHPPEISHYGFHYGRATDAFERISFVNPSSELSSALTDLLKSPRTRSSHAYYDDGVSSYEVTDDQSLNLHKHGSKHAYRVANHAGSDARARRDRVPDSSNYRTQQHFRNSTAILPQRRHYPLKYSKLDQDELLESTRLGHAGRNWIHLERDEYLPRPSLCRRGYLATSKQIPNELYSNFSSPDRAAYTDQEKLELLRMVSELQDQLKKASLKNKGTAQVKLRDHQIPMSYDHEVELEERLHNSVVHRRYPGRSRDGNIWSQQRKYSRIPFSAEATCNRHQADHSLCCCPREQKRSTQLPHSGLGHNEGFRKAHSRPNLYNSYGYCSSSPHRHVDPQFSMYSHGSKSDEQKHRDGVRSYFREKHHLPKKHLRPLAGGAPIITCPYCLKELQLPADFLLFKRRYHQLRCGACSEVLKLSLENNTHLIPYMPVAEAPPPSGVDEYSETIHRRNFTSTSHVTGCPSVSCSDDYGQSLCKSCSQRNGVERKISNHLLEHEQERKMSCLNETRSKGKTPVEYESAGPSSTSQSKMISSEIEELPEEAERGRSSPLHRLMGYSSAREVIYS